MPHESISIFDMFKIGVGPSSSHTLGPWRAALNCLNDIEQKSSFHEVASITVLLYGSLAKTGKGHGTDIAVMLGLGGEDPVTIPVDSITTKIQRIASEKRLSLNGIASIDFDISENIHFLFQETLLYHPNGLSFLVSLKNGENFCSTYFSIGGGFVVKEGTPANESYAIDLPFPINTANDLLHWCMKGMAIHEVVMDNEGAWRSETKTRAGILAIWEAMKACTFRGCHADGALPGGLQVRRRAFELNKRLL